MVHLRKMEPGRVVLTALLVLSQLLSPLAANADDAKPVYQDTDSNGANYLANRRALVGPGCVINSLFDGVKVVAGTADLQNLVDDDLTNSCKLPSVADVGAAVEPLVSVRDIDHAYAKGTEVGFALEASSDSKLLSLDISSFYRIWFYLDGKKVGDAPVEQGQSIKGLSLTLIQVPGSKDFTKDIVATAPAKFDEIKLIQAGVDVTAVSSINIRYAFVGKSRQYTLTNSSEGGMADYAAATGRESITVEGHGLPGDLLKDGLPQKLVDDDLDNGYTVESVIAIGSSLPATVVTKSSDGSETFKAGTEVGFVYTNTTGLELGLVESIVVELYDKDNNSVGKYDISSSVLGLGVVGSNQAGFTINAPKDFSSAKILFPTLLKLTLGAVTVNYAFVRPAPSLASHHCDIELESSHAICSCQDSYRLSYNHEVDGVTFKVEGPEGATPSVSDDGYVQGMTVPGAYTITATAADGCSETTVINVGNVQAYDPTVNGEKILVNTDDDHNLYALSDETGGGLIQLSSGVKGRKALLTPSLRDVCYLKASVDVAADKAIVGVKSVDGADMAEEFEANPMKVGFVVSTGATALNADVLSMFNIRLYRNGKVVKSEVPKHWNAIGAGLIGNEPARKMRCYIDIDAGTQFDEMVLWKSGVLNANLAQFNVYYAFIDDSNTAIPSEDGLYGAEIISHDGTNASIDYSNTDIVSLANIGNGLGDVSNLIDGDITTGTTFPLGVSAGAASVAVNLGRTVGDGQQLVVAMQKIKEGLGVQLGNAIQLQTWLDGVKQETLTSWKVLGADVIGDGGQTYAVLNPTKDFDAVRIVPGSVVGALTNIEVYAIALRDDSNGDGIPNVIDNEPCIKELVLDEDKTFDRPAATEYERVVMHRTLSATGGTTGDYTWNSIMLPVTMDASQFAAMFGSEAKLAGLSRVEGNWIYFEEIPVDGNFALQANTPYLVKPSRQPDMDADTQYESTDGTIVPGPVYFGNGDYGGTESVDESLTYSVKGDSSYGDITFTGSYANPSAVAAGSYMLRNGEMIRTAVDHNIKAYRCWLATDAISSAAASKQLKLCVRTIGGQSTGITAVDESGVAACDGVYNLNGQRIGGFAAAQSNSVNASLPKGVYVVNGKKRIIK